MGEIIDKHIRQMFAGHPFNKWGELGRVRGHNPSLRH
jgi:hypothetical protein